MQKKEEKIITDIMNKELCLILTYGESNGLTKITPNGLFKANQIISYDSEMVSEIKEDYSEEFTNTYFADEIEFICSKTNQKIYIPVYMCIELFKKNASINGKLLLNKDTKTADSLCWKLTQKAEGKENISERLEKKVEDAFCYGVATSLLDVNAVYTDEKERELSTNYSLVALPSYIYKDEEIDAILKEIGERKNK